MFMLVSRKVVRHLQPKKKIKQNLSDIYLCWNRIMITDLGSLQTERKTAEDLVYQIRC